MKRQRIPSRTSWVFGPVLAALAVAPSGCGGEGPCVLAASVHMDPLLSQDVRTLSVFVYGPKRTDQKYVTCASLMMQQIESTDARLEVLGRADFDFTEAVAREVRLEAIPAGEQRYIFVEARGVNDRYLANGCEPVDLGSGETVSKTVVVYRPRI